MAVSASRMPLFGAGDGIVRMGRADEIVAPGEPAVNGTPVSVSTTTPAAFFTVKVEKPFDRPGPAPRVESKMVATVVSSHEYLILSRETALCGNDAGPFDGAASARNTGPETIRAYVCPPRSRRPFALESSPASRRRLPLASSFGPVIVIWPVMAPPAPLFTVTRQLPRSSCESAGLVSLFRSN